MEEEGYRTKATNDNNELALRTSEAAAGVKREDSHWKVHAG